MLSLLSGPARGARRSRRVECPAQRRGPVWPDGVNALTRRWSGAGRVRQPDAAACPCVYVRRDPGQRVGARLVGGEHAGASLHHHHSLVGRRLAASRDGDVEAAVPRQAEHRQGRAELAPGLLAPGDPRRVLVEGAVPRAGDARAVAADDDDAPRAAALAAGADDDVREAIRVEAARLDDRAELVAGLVRAADPRRVLGEPERRAAEAAREAEPDADLTGVQERAGRQLVVG